MHAEFADWYRFVSIDPKETDLKSRWAAAEGFSKKASADDLLDAARVFYGRSTRDPTFVQRFTASFKHSIDELSARVAKTELPLLAGASLAATFGPADMKGTVAALSLVCAHFCTQRTAPIADIVRVAREYLSSLSAGLRKATPVGLPKPSRFESESAAALETLRKAIQAGGAPATWVDPLTNVLGPWRQALVSVFEWAQGKEKQHNLRSEESDVLWWLFAEHSRDMQILFDDLQPPAIVLVAAKEMADLTRTFPGPYAAHAFLDKAVRGELFQTRQRLQARRLSRWRTPSQRAHLNGARPLRPPDPRSTHWLICVPHAWPSRKQSSPVERRLGTESSPI